MFCPWRAAHPSFFTLSDNWNSRAEKRRRICCGFDWLFYRLWMCRVHCLYVAGGGFPPSKRHLTPRAATSHLRPPPRRNICETAASDNFLREPDSRSQSNSQTQTGSCATTSCSLLWCSWWVSCVRRAPPDWPRAWPQTPPDAPSLWHINITQPLNFNTIQSVFNKSQPHTLYFTCCIASAPSIRWNKVVNIKWKDVWYFWRESEVVICQIFFYLKTWSSSVSCGCVKKLRLKS
jgi:hypothetical protein